jgi:hypothetical protein
MFDNYEKKIDFFKTSLKDNYMNLKRSLDGTTITPYNANVNYNSINANFNFMGNSGGANPNAYESVHQKGMNAMEVYTEEYSKPPQHGQDSCSPKFSKSKNKHVVVDSNEMFNKHTVKDYHTARARSVAVNSNIGSSNDLALHAVGNPANAKFTVNNNNAIDPIIVSKKSLESNWIKTTRNDVDKEKKDLFLNNYSGGDNLCTSPMREGTLHTTKNFYSTEKDKMKFTPRNNGQ